MLSLLPLPIVSTSAVATTSLPAGPPLGPAAAPAMTARALFETQLPYVLRVLRYLGVAASDAEDVAQDVFVAVHRSLPSYEGRGSVQSWLYGICRRSLSDHRKRAYRRRESPSDDIEPAAQEPSQERDLAFRRALSRLDEILDGLDDDKRTVFILYEVEQLTMKEITDAIGCPLQTGYTRLRAARAHVENTTRREAGR